MSDGKVTSHLVNLVVEGFEPECKLSEQDKTALKLLIESVAIAASNHGYKVQEFGWNKGD